VSGARPLGVARSLEQSSARFGSCGFYPTSVSETHPVQLERRNVYALRLKPPTSCRWLGCPWAVLHRCPWGGAASALWGGGRVIQRFLQGARKSSMWRSRPARYPGGRHSVLRRHLSASPSTIISIQLPHLAELPVGCKRGR
jgi:hypothetical protein